MRLDQWLVRQGLAGSRTLAAKAVAQGAVSVNGRVVTKASRPVTGTEQIRVQQDQDSRYVSRAGHKLAGALQAFPDVRVAGRRCLDAGASTGGFTQVLLEGGAAAVEAVDVGHGQLHPMVSADPRVTSREGTNVRYLVPEDIGGPVELVVADLSFISLTLVLPALAACLAPVGDMVLMVKPQFEVGRSRLGKNGVVRDPAEQQRAVAAVVDCALGLGLQVLGQQPSTLPGQDGNQEFFLHLVAGGPVQVRDQQDPAAALA